MGRVERIAVLGGDGRIVRGHRWPRKPRVYPSSRRSGARAVDRLEQSIRAGGTDRVIILARFVGHSATRRIRRVCAQAGVAVELWERGG